MSDRFHPFLPFPTSPAPRPPAEEAAEIGEPWGLLDSADLPEAYGVDELTLLWRDPHVLFAHWEVTAHGFSTAQNTLGQEGALVLRVESGGRFGDEPLPHPVGRGYLPAPRAGVRVRAAVGLRSPSGVFVPIATAPEVGIPPDRGVPETPVTWMTVAPDEPGPPRVLSISTESLPDRRPRLAPVEVAHIPSSPSGKVQQ